MLHDKALYLIKLGGHGVHLGTDEGAGLVHKVDSLIGEKAVGDISVGKGGGSDEGLVLYLYAVEDLISLLESS